MEREHLQSAAVSYTYFKGLYAIPGGLLAIVAALRNWAWGPLRHAGSSSSLVLLGAAYLLIASYYNEHYGRVTPSTRQQVRARSRSSSSASARVRRVAAAAAAARDWSLDLPVNPTAVSFALSCSSSYAVVGRCCERHHVIVSARSWWPASLPVWNGADTQQHRPPARGVAFIGRGHPRPPPARADLRPADRLRLEHGNAGA